MKQVLTMLLVGILIIGLAGCGNSEQNNNQGNASTAEQNGSETVTEESTASEQEDDGAINLIVWGGVPAESGPQNLVDAWNQEHPNVQVEYVRFVNDDTGNTKLDTAILSGEQIDLFFTYSVDLMKKRVDGGLVEPLEAYGAEVFIEEEVIGAGNGQVLIEDQLYGLPTATEPIGIMINQSMLTEKNIEIPENWTVDDFFDIAEALSGEKDGQKIYGTHAYYAGLPLDFARTVLGGDYLYKENGQESNFDAEEFKANARVKELMDNGYAMSFDELFSRKFQSYAHPAFLNGEVAMMPFSAWMLRYVQDSENFPHDFVTTFAPYPTTAEGVENNYQGQLNNHLSISSNSQYKNEAWEFMKYWITEGSQYMYAGGKLPVWNKADPEEVLKGVLGENASELFDIDAYREVMLNEDLEFIVDTITTAYPQIMQIYKEESEMYFLDVYSSQDEYLSILKERSDAAIKEVAE